jgi:hypothetical protein
MNKFIQGFIVCASVLAAFSAQAGSHFQDRAGIGLRGGYWNLREHDAMVRVSTSAFFHNQVDVGGAGGWITFFSGVGERGSIEFHLGGMAHVETREQGLFNNQKDITAVTGILIGYQFPIFKDRNLSAFQPYVSAGGGPYVITRVHSIEYCLMNDEITVKNRVRPGIYASLGTYFDLTEWLAIHGEMRYHLVNFNPDNGYSGFELSLGLALSWHR